MSKFKVGDRVRFVAGGGYFCNPDSKSVEGMRDHFKSEKYVNGKEYVVERIKYSPKNSMDFYDVGIGNWHSETSFSGGEGINLTNTFKNMIEKARMLFMSEPEKTYTKAGILGPDGYITADGTKLYLTWLLKRDKDFKSEVADELVKEQK